MTDAEERATVYAKALVRLRELARLYPFGVPAEWVTKIVKEALKGEGDEREEG